MLAFWAVVGASSSQHQTPDRNLAAAAGLARAQIDAVLELKKTARTVGIHIIGDRRTSQPDRVLERLAEG